MWPLPTTSTNVLGILLGLIAAWKSRTSVDYAALLGSLFAWSLPTFWLGMMLLFWGSVTWGYRWAAKLPPAQIMPPNGKDGLTLRAI
jgi:peptide/nickel transport system permease protein